MANNTTDETIDALKSAQTKPSEALSKAVTQGWQQGSGLVHYDLEAPAKKLYPVITPLRNMIPRVPGDGGTATNWKAITGINTTAMHMGVGESRRSGFITNETRDYTASYAGIGLESFVTFEGEYAAENFDDLRARAVESLLRSFFIGEEQLILGGNASLSLGQTPTPALSELAVSTSTSLTNDPHEVYCVALTHDGFYRSSVSATGVPFTETRADADGGASLVISGGAAQVSASAQIHPGAGAAVYAQVAPVTGAYAYAWYFGLVSGDKRIAAITTTAAVVLDALPDSNNQNVTAAPAADHSRDTTVFDGILTQCSISGNNSYVSHLANVDDAAALAAYNANQAVGTKLQSDNAGGIKQIDEALQSFWDNYRVSPDMIIVSGQELKNLTHLLIQSGGANLFQFTMSGTGEDVGGRTITAGTVIGSYLNKFTMSGGQMVKVMLHPNLAPGTILFYSSSIPYPLSNVSNVMQIKARRTYYQIEWPLRQRRYEFGVYCDELLQCYFPPAFGYISNIADGV